MGKWVFYWGTKKKEIQAAVTQAMTGVAAFVDISDIIQVSRRKEIFAGTWHMTVERPGRRTGTGGNVSAAELANIVEPMLQEGQRARFHIKADNPRVILEVTQEEPVLPGWRHPV